MSNYIVKQGETITDAVLNSAGAISFWITLLTLNNLPSWTSDVSGVLLVPDIVDQNAVRQLATYPAFSGKSDQIKSINDTLEARTNVNSDVPIDFTFVPALLKPLPGESITDIILNKLGSINYWDQFLSVNNFSDWNELKDYQLPNVTIDQNTIRGLSIYPAVNGKILDPVMFRITAILASNEIENTDIPVPVPVENYDYIVRPGETITDVILNMTGNYTFWDALLTINSIQDWTIQPKTGAKIKLPLGQIDQNAVRQLVSYPACNSSVSDINEQINALGQAIDDNWILQTGFWEDQRIWIDGKYWID